MKILIATDGSDFSNEAIKKCCRMIITGADTAIKVISVYEGVPILGTEPFAVSLDYVNEANKALKIEAERQVFEAVKLIQELLPETKADLTTKVEMGIPERNVVETAREWQADLIVVGSHGRGFWGRAMIGSTSDAIIHNSPCPVLVVREAESESVKSTASGR